MAFGNKTAVHNQIAHWLKRNMSISKILAERLEKVR